MHQSRSSRASTPPSRLQPGEGFATARIPLSDDWLSWDPETIHRYPDPGPEVLDSEPASPPASPTSSTRVQRARHPVWEVPYYILLGLLSGAAAAAVFLLVIPWLFAGTQ